jgi:hypothetical protein
MCPGHDVGGFLVPGASVRYRPHPVPGVVAVMEPLLETLLSVPFSFIKSHIKGKRYVTFR